MPFIGPAVVASIAYMDPGNFATNIQAGARHGYMLLWVVLLANVIAMLFQALSARLGIVAGHSLAALCRTHFPRPLVIVMWLASEVAAMATDLAELIGAAIGISVLFHLPLLVGLLITFAITWGLLTFQSRGFRPIELIITGFVGIIGLAYLVELFIAPPDWGQFFYHTVVPQLAGADSVTLAVGIVGATVMPHAIYLHSAMMTNRVKACTEAQRRRLVKFSNIEVVIALSLAGLVNMAMVAMAATMFHQGHSDVGEIETAYHTLLPLMGVVAAGAFMASLLASGLSSSVVGTMAGQVIMQDFVGFRIPMWVRRVGHHGAGGGGCGDGRAGDRCAGHEPGGAEPGAAGADDRAAGADPPPGGDGGAGDRAPDAGAGGGGNGCRAGPEWHPAVAKFLNFGRPWGR